MASITYAGFLASGVGEVPVGNGPGTSIRKLTHSFVSLVVLAAAYPSASDRNSQDSTLSVEDARPANVGLLAALPPNAGTVSVESFVKDAD